MKKEDKHPPTAWAIVNEMKAMTKEDILEEFRLEPAVLKADETLLNALVSDALSQYAKEIQDKVVPMKVEKGDTPKTVMVDYIKGWNACREQMINNFKGL